MLFVRVKRSAPRINDMVELSRRANGGSQCPLASGFASAAPLCALAKGLTAVVRGVPDYRNIGTIRTSSIIPIAGLVEVHVGPWFGAAHECKPVDEPEAGREQQPTLAIEDSPPMPIVGIFLNRANIPEDVMVRRRQRLEPPLERAPAAYACAWPEGDDSFDFLAALVQAAFPTGFLRQLFGVTQ